VSGRAPTDINAKFIVKRMVSTGLTDAVYLSIMYSLLAASAITWIFFLEATLSRDPVTL